MHTRDGSHLCKQVLSTAFTMHAHLQHRRVGILGLKGPPHAWQDYAQELHQVLFNAGALQSQLVAAAKKEPEGSGMGWFHPMADRSEGLIILDLLIINITKTKTN